MRLLIIGMAVSFISQASYVKSAPQIKWVNALSTSSAEGQAVFIGKCTNLLVTKACPEGKPVSGVLRVGNTINGMKVGAIRCEYQSKTIRGWRGGPNYVAIEGTYNCKAAASKWHVEQTDVRPWVMVVGANL